MTVEPVDSCQGHCMILSCFIMDTLQAFLLASAAWLSLQALGYLLAPQLVVTILEARASSGKSGYHHI